MDNNGKVDKRLIWGKLVYNFSAVYIPLYLSHHDGTIVVDRILAPQCKDLDELYMSIANNLCKQETGAK